MASADASPIPPGPPEGEWDVEDEVDQLDSDSGEDDSASVGGGKGSVVLPDRTPGNSLLPAIRLENIIQADGVTGNLALSKEGLFVLSVATEEFIKRMAQAGQRQASSERRNYITYRDMAGTTQQYQEFMFLHDTIPSPLTLAEAFALREAKERELQEEDPAMLTAVPSAVSHPQPPKPKPPRPRQDAPNGKPASSSAGPSRQERRLMPRDPSPTHATSQNQTPQGNDIYHPYYPNRTSRRNPPADSASWGSAPQQSSPPRGSPPEAQPSTTTPEIWPAQYSGPASGFLQGPGAPFGRNPPNPGRTIYSQQKHGDE